MCGMVRPSRAWLFLADRDILPTLRLGERTPVGIRMAGPPANLPENWMFCHTARQFRAAVASVNEGTIPGIHAGPTEELRARRVVERADGATAMGEW